MELAVDAVSDAEAELGELGDKRVGGCINVEVEKEWAGGAALLDACG